MSFLHFYSGQMDFLSLVRQRFDEVLGVAESKIWEEEYNMKKINMSIKAKTEEKAIMEPMLFTNFFSPHTHLCNLPT